MHKRMAEEAREEGCKDIAFLFDSVAGIEKTHEERYQKLLQNIKDGTVFAKKEKTVWICRNCGHIVDSEKAPEKCPVCSHPQAYFELRVIFMWHCVGRKCCLPKMRVQEIALI